MKKRLLALLLVALMVATMLPAAALAVEPEEPAEPAAVEQAVPAEPQETEDEALPGEAETETLPEAATEPSAEPEAAVPAPAPAADGDLELPVLTDLTITNNTGMFKAETAQLVSSDDGTVLVVALSGSGYHELFKGTYEQAVANGDNRDNWIHGATNAAGKWEFRIPVAAGETYIPVVAISQSYLDKYASGQNSLARAFYPRQMEIDAEAATLVTGDYEYTQALTVTNNVKMFKVSGAALHTVGGPNSNGYKADLVLTMGSESFDKVFVGTAAEAAAAETPIGIGDDLTAEIPVKWVETFGQPETMKTLIGEAFTMSFHSVSKDAWYERVFTISEADGTLVIDNATVVTELAITNNTGMFKAVTATLETTGSDTVLVFALSGTGYHELFKGTYEQAVANGDNRDNWIHGATNADGKWEFRLPVAAGETYIPVVAISQSYLEKYENGQNSLARAFYPRQLEIDAEAATLVTGDYEYTQTLTVTNNVKMFKVEGAALHTVGGPNSNGYKADLVLTMGSDSFDKAFVGYADEAAAAETVIAIGDDLTAEIPVKWVETFGQPETMKTLIGEAFTMSFHSVSKDAWYERVFTISEADGTLVIDPAPDPQYLVVSFELYDDATHTTALLTNPAKVRFTPEDTGKTIAEKLLGAENVGISDTGWMQSFTIDEVLYSPESMELATGSWLVYRNNSQDSVGPADYKPAAGDVYRFVLTSYDPVTYAMPVLCNDMNALYWSVADYDGDLTSAYALIQKDGGAAQADIDAMTATLAKAGGSHYVLIDGRTVQVNTTTYPYTYFTTLTADKAAAAAGETVTVTLTAPEGVNLLEGTLKANGTALTKGEDGTYIFTMPDAHVSVTAEFENAMSGKLWTAAFSYDAAGEQVIELTPAFDSDVFEYEITLAESKLPRNNSTFYFTGTFDEGATAKWYAYMNYGGSGTYTDANSVTSGTPVALRKSTFLAYGNGEKHRLDVTSPGVTVTQYFFRMTVVPVLSELEIDGESVEGFTPEKTEYAVTLPEGTESIKIMASPMDDNNYVYFEGGTVDDDIADEETEVDLVTGENRIVIIVDNDEGLTNTYTLTVTVPAPAPKLADLTFRAASGAAAAELPMEPAFDPDVREYTVYLADCNTYAYTWASLPEGAEGEITLEYANASSGAALTKTVKPGTGLYTNNMGVSNSAAPGSDITVKVDGETAYTVHVLRQATLKAGTSATGGLRITVGEDVVTLTPAYNRTVFGYELNTAADTVFSVLANPTISGAALTINGAAAEAGTAVSVTPAWADRSFDLVIRVDAEGALSGVYTVAVKEAPASLTIEKAPDKTVYAIGDTFDPTGMEVAATYADGAVVRLTAEDFTFSPDGPLTLADTTITISYAGLKAEQAISFTTAFDGAGTEADPFQIKTAEDMQTLDGYVENGEPFAGTYLKVLADITLTEGWNGVGAAGKPFGGNFDGAGHTLTIPSGGKALFAFVRGAEIHDLAVYGEKIDDYGLVSIYTSDSGVASVAVFDNVTLKAGTQTLYSGFIGGYASGSNLVTIKNCTIEAGVTVGYDKQQSNIGGFGGEYNGTIENSVSNATVYGVNYVGGVVANKGQSMGTFKVDGCTFGGTVEATGSYVGGIVGAGYGGTRWGMTSAWSTPGVTIDNCTSTGTVKGDKGVGGIFGGEGAQAQAWDNGPTYIRNNSFTGKVSGNAFVGGDIGFMLSLNRNSYIEHNYYAPDCGAEAGIGAVGGIDTTGHESGTIDTVFYFSSQVTEEHTLAMIRDEVPGHALENYIEIEGTSNSKTLASAGYKNQFKGDHNRTDDPLGADAFDLCYTDVDDGLLDYGGDDLKFVKEDGETAFGMYTAQPGTKVTLSEDGESIQITFYPKNVTTYKGMYLYAAIGDESTWKEENYLTPAETAAGPYGMYTFTLSKDKCGKMIPVAPVKAKDGATTSVQYYLAIPAESKLPYYVGADDAQVYVTISNAGVLALARASVTVKDIDKDGVLTYDEALVAAHEAYCPDGAAGYSTSGTMVRTLWGVDTGGSCMFVLNDAFIRNGVTTDTVKAKDDLVAAIMSDTDVYYYTDYHSYYTEKEKTVTAGESFDLTLVLVPDDMMGLGDTSPAGLQAGIWADGKFTAIEGAVADAAGKVTLSFAEPGTYVVSAAGTVEYEAWGMTCPIFAPVCIVTVEPVPAEDAVVYVTVSNEGVLALARAEVTVKDTNRDGMLSYDEALAAAHEAYCEGGYAAGEGAWGYAVSKLWNVENGGGYTFNLNDESFYTTVDQTEVKEGDDLVAAVMKDTAYWSDHYTYFTEKELTGAPGQTFTLTLMNTYTGTPVAAAGLNVGTWDEVSGMFVAIAGAKTDADGKVELSFAEPGTYVISAEGTIEDDVTINWTTYETAKMDCPIVAPAAILTVERMPVFKSQSLILSGEIGMNFYLDLSQLTGDERSASFVEFTVGKAAPVQVPFDANKVNSKGYFGFTCFVKSIQMADTITAVYHYGDGKTITKEYSVLRYIQAVEKNASSFDAKTLALVRSIADFGHYAQIYLAEVNGWTIGEDYTEMALHFADTYDYADILSKVQANAFVKAIDGTNITKATYKLHLDAETTVDVYLTTKDGKAPTNVTLTIHEEETGKDTTKKVTPVKQSDGRYLIRISGISAHKLGDMIEITGKAGKDFTVQVSALSYVRSVLNNSGSTTAAKNCMAALYKYYEATMAYRK